MSDDPVLGTRVDRYRIVRAIGRGGMGTVYEAVHETIGSRVAIKVIAEQFARDAELLDRFFAEARAVNLIRHENIVNVIDLARLADGRPYIVMELVDGRTLRDHIRDGVPLGGLVHVMVDVLSALAAAHAIGIVHRDLKPDNILISATGRAKVLDFGIAKLVALPGQPTLPRTQTGVVLGTPEYMAPEQISGGGADARSDLYALGVVLYEAVVGRRPFDGDSDFEIMRGHVDVPPVPPSALRADLPRALEDVIVCALAKRPQDRFASAGAMANALRAAAASLPERERRALTPGGRLLPLRRVTEVTPAGAERPPTQATVRERPHRRTRRRWPWLAIPVAGCAAVALVVAARGDESRPTPSPAALPVAATPATRPPAPVAAPSGAAVELAAPYDPDHFDPIAHLAEAELLARTQVPDAELAFLRVDDVGASGAHLNGSYTNAYVFVSPSHASPCKVAVAALRERMVARTGNDNCELKSGTPPRCSLIDLLANVKERVGDRASYVAWNRGEGWFVSVMHGDSFRLPDRCDRPRVATREEPPPRRAEGRELDHLEKPVAQPGDGYDPKNFDFRAYLPRAREIAQHQLPGGMLSEIVLQSVMGDGRVDLTSHGFARYTFTKQTSDPTCRVLVDVRENRVETSPWGYECDGHEIALPSCSLRTLRELTTRTSAASRDEPGRVTFNVRGYRFESASVSGPYGHCEAAAQPKPRTVEPIDEVVQGYVTSHSIQKLAPEAERIARKLERDAVLVELDAEGTRSPDLWPVEFPRRRFVLVYATASACITVSVDDTAMYARRSTGTCLHRPTTVPQCAPQQAVLDVGANRIPAGSSVKTKWTAGGWSIVVTDQQGLLIGRFTAKDDC